MRKKIQEFIERSRVGLVLLFFVLISMSTYAQQEVTVRGVVRDTLEGMPGVAVKVVGGSRGVVSDAVGRFSIVTDRNATLSFTFVGLKTAVINLREKKVENGVIELNVLLTSENTTLQEVAITGFGASQKKASMVSSITSVDVKEMKTPSSNLTNALAGKVAGIISFQTSGEPGLGTDNSSFFIRGLSTFGSGKRDPLILIDGVESSATDMARLQTDDIADFSVLKDAAAASIYGARGANGVVLINSKLGKNGKPQFNFRAENKISSNTKNFQLADNVTYMNLSNEAILTRNPLGIEPYTQNKIMSTASGADPYLYPNNNWTDRLIRDYTINQSYNLNITGGSTRARYFMAGTFNRDNGILKVDPINNFNNNVRLNNYSIRSNVDFDVTKSTVLVVRMYGQFDDYNGPIGTYDPNQPNRLRSGGETTFYNTLNANPVMFPATYPQSMLQYIEHPLFGSSRTRNLDASFNPSLYVNPYAEMVRGYQTYKTSNLSPQLEIKQDLGGLTTGLKARAMAYLRRVSFFSVNRAYSPFYYQTIVDPTDQSYELTALNDGGQNSAQPVGQEYLGYDDSSVPRTIDSRFWLEGSLSYDRTFKEKHTVGGMLVSYMSNYETSNGGGLVGSLPARNQGVSGRFTYGFDDRYLAEFNFGFNGSERFDKSHRYGFFPSAGIGYRVSSEKFFAPLTAVISNLKLRATYGLVGNDAIGSSGDRFFYLSDVNLNNPSYGATFGRNDGSPPDSNNGISINRYANSNITWEQSKQLNLGIDLGIANRVDIVFDAFKQNRSQILERIQSIDNASGLMAIPFANSGQAEIKGIDISASYRNRFGEHFRTNTRGTFTFSSSKVVKADEIAYGNSLSHLSRIGYPINQPFGYIAERLFVDDAEVANSPIQFNDNVNVKAGDIKYRDINNDGMINSDDQVAIGYPNQPQIIYGFGSTLEYKKFDFNFYFQGSARSSFFIDPNAIQPFIQSGGYQKGLLQAVADDHWSETNRNVYAFWPRLNPLHSNNNNQASTWWLRNGSFLRLKQVDLGYTFSKLEKISVKNARLYFSATNLFVMSKFKMWDVEMGGNGLGYPLQSIYNLGLQVNL
ncbi:SusC/RagA family TonB-linked outer membrane protein [Paradesertivirga mongoliensis]|uniref:SusC/RagA family TonB-linked outer membrane protein n=1 Tax=Paradesertivirga mongoliensis TaxID=2100740 RepID=A0ABW4ZL15_9SPHI|nr:TonB-dependent receptor [Pedobacter mongoliensis]